MHDWTQNPGLVERAAERRRRHGRAYFYPGVVMLLGAGAGAIAVVSHNASQPPAVFALTLGFAAAWGVPVALSIAAVTTIGRRLLRPVVPPSTLRSGYVCEDSPDVLRLRMATTGSLGVVALAVGAMSVPLAAAVGPLAGAVAGRSTTAASALLFWFVWTGLLTLWGLAWRRWARRRAESGRHDLVIEPAAAQVTFPRVIHGSAKRLGGKTLPLIQLRLVELRTEFGGGRKTVRSDAKGTHFWWSLHLWIGPDDASAEEGLLVRGLDEHTARSLADLIANAAGCRILAGEPGVD